MVRERGSGKHGNDIAQWAISIVMMLQEQFTNMETHTHNKDAAGTVSYFISGRCLSV